MKYINLSFMASNTRKQRLIARDTYDALALLDLCDTSSMSAMAQLQMKQIRRDVKALADELIANSKRTDRKLRRAVQRHRFLNWWYDDYRYDFTL